MAGRGGGKSAADTGKDKDDEEIEAKHWHFRGELGQKAIAGRRAQGPVNRPAQSLSVVDPCLPGSLGMIAA